MTMYMGMRTIGIVTLVSLFLISCDSEGEKKRSNKPELDRSDNVADSSELYESAKTIFYSMPSPLELSTLIKTAGGEFRLDLLVSPTNNNQYQSTFKKSLILGLYAADMSYATIYDQQNEAIKYLAACKRVGESIGVHEAFSASLIERANANIGDRDSMLNIMTEMYWATSSQLQEENRDQIALLAMSAGWIEGLYIGSSLLDPENPDPEIAKRMAEQKFAAAQLKEIYDSYPAGDPLVDEAKPMLEPLFELFGSLNATIDTPNSTSQSKSGVTTIGGKRTIEFNKEHITRLKELAESLRTKIVNP